MIDANTLLFLLWIFLFWMWFRSETFEMSAMITTIFTPFSIFYMLYGLPTGIHWLFQLIIILIGFIVLGYTIDMKYREKK